MNARTFDLTPFHRATVGFDKLFDVMDRQWANSVNTGYPPYNIVKVDDNNYEISLALAGFVMDDLSITHNGNELKIEGNPDVDRLEVGSEYLHKGIANRAFTRVFTLADHVEVKSARLTNGILTISLERILPEELQPKKIAITYGN